MTDMFRVPGRFVKVTSRLHHQVNKGKGIIPLDNKKRGGRIRGFNPTITTTLIKTSEKVKEYTCIYTRI